MESIVSKNLSVQFTDYTVGVVISADDRYPIGFKSVDWTNADNNDMWKVKDFDLNGPLASEDAEPKKIDIGNKYHKSVPGSIIDVYDVLVAFNVTNPATQHAVKKLLMPGSRGHKNVLTDLEEAHNSIKRAIQIEKGESLEQ